MKEKLKRFRPTSGALVTALLILIIGLSLFLLIRSGILVPHPGKEDGKVDRAGILPQLEKTAEPEAIYAEIRDTDPADLLLQLRESDTYIWSFSSVEAWENRYTAERTVIRRSGEKYRIERDNLLVICDGERVYRLEGMLETIYPADQTSMYLEAGLTPLDSIRDNPGGCTVEYDDPINPKTIRISRVRDGYRDEFEVSIESGLPVTERSYIGTMVYRMILTNSVTGKTADEFDAKTFLIPEKNRTGE